MQKSLTGCECLWRSIDACRCGRARQWGNSYKKTSRQSIDFIRYRILFFSGAAHQKNGSEKGLGYCDCFPEVRDWGLFVLSHYYSGSSQTFFTLSYLMPVVPDLLLNARLHTNFRSFPPLSRSIPTPTSLWLFSLQTHNCDTCKRRSYTLVQTH